MKFLGSEGPSFLFFLKRTFSTPISEDIVEYPDIEYLNFMLSVFLTVSQHSLILTVYYNTSKTDPGRGSDHYLSTQTLLDT